MTNKLLISAAILFVCLSSACNNTEQQDKSGGEEQELTTTGSSEPQFKFVIDVNPLDTLGFVPAVQSGVWARSGNKILVFGGRTQGYHGTESSGASLIFGKNQANASIYVVDLSDYSYTQYDIKSTDPSLLQFSSSNMEYCQVGDTLYIVGGYGRQSATDKQSHYTFDQIKAIQVSQMIGEVENSGDPFNSIIGSVSSPFLQVTGGELDFYDGYFYLMFGQNFVGVYGEDSTGLYTNSIRKFKFNGTVVSDTSSVTHDLLHRRDLNVAKGIQGDKQYFLAYGGVFSPSGDGFPEPIIIDPNGDQVKWTIDSLSQKTNHYNSAVVNIYDSESGNNYHCILGGIGQNQYIKKDGTWQWEEGDNGNKLPFVKTITQMVWNENGVYQLIQLPPDQPELPTGLGANAFFIANSDYVYGDNTIDYSKLKQGDNVIGIMYGGINSKDPSSDPYNNPTSVNTTIYQVIVRI